jgi:hypothetical protein
MLIYKLIFLAFTFLVSASAVMAFLSKQVDDSKLDKMELWVYSFALGPFLLTAILYFSLLLFPFYNQIVYLCIPIIIFSALIIIYFKNIPFAYLGRQLFHVTKQNILIRLFFLVLFIVFVMYAKSVPVIGHDVLEYATLGKYIAIDRLIEYKSNYYYPETGFYYVGLHGFSFPLLITWEHLFNSIIDFNNSLIIKVITFYYGFLLFILIHLILKQYANELAYLALFILITNLGFLSVIFSYHLDTARIFLHTALFIAMYRLLQNWSFQTILLFSLIAGALSFLHSLGFITAGVLSIIILLSNKLPIKMKLSAALQMLIIILLMGGVHYFLDIFIGTGWVFNSSLKFY